MRAGEFSEFVQPDYKLLGQKQRTRAKPWLKQLTANPQQLHLSRPLVLSHSHVNLFHSCTFSAAGVRLHLQLHSSTREPGRVAHVCVSVCRENGWIRPQKALPMSLFSSLPPLWWLYIHISPQKGGRGSGAKSSWVCMNRQYVE